MLINSTDTTRNYRFLTAFSVIVFLILVILFSIFLIYRKIAESNKTIKNSEITLNENLSSGFTDKNSNETILQFGELTLDNIFSNDHSWTSTISAQKKWTLITTGDVIPARSVNNREVRKNNFRWPFEKTADILKQGDITYINLETPFIKDCPATTEGMIFCGSEKNIEGLTYSGVKVVNLANNHSANYGSLGISNTVKLLDDNSIKYTGLGSPALFEIKGIRLALLGFNDITGGVDPVADSDKDKIASETARLKKENDLVIIGLHFGTEYQAQPDARQIELAHLAIDSGADLVLGNHPHWIQPVEIFKDKLIIYAHGNFIFDQMWSEKTREGVIGKFTFYGKNLIDVEFIPIYISDYGQPALADDNRKVRILREMKEESIRLLNMKNSELSPDKVKNSLY